jgi:ribose 5-phosphate isomerase
LSGKKSQQQQAQSELMTTADSQQQLEQYIFSSDSQQTNVSTSGYSSFLENRLKMQPTSNLDDLDNLDLTTDSLPAVDTPDACDKAALR